MGESSGPQGGKGGGKRSGPLSVDPMGKGRAARDAGEGDRSVHPFR